MTKKQGNELNPGFYRIFWKQGGCNFGTIGYAMRHVSDAGKFLPLDRSILCPHWATALLGSEMWRKIARVERVKVEGEL